MCCISIVQSNRFAWAIFEAFERSKLLWAFHQQLLGKGPQGICRDAGIRWSTNREGKRSQQGFQAPWLKCKFQEEWLGTWWLPATFQIQHGHHLREVVRAHFLVPHLRWVASVFLPAWSYRACMSTDMHKHAHSHTHTHTNMLYIKEIQSLFM